MGGLVLSQVFTLYTTPVIYLYLDRLRSKVARWSARLPWNRQAPTTDTPDAPDTGAQS
jgi:multidrug efflux pump